MKAKARMKLVVRIWLSPVSVASSARRLVDNVVAASCFQTSAPKRKMVSSRRELFRRPRRTKHWPEKLNKFSDDALPSEHRAARNKTVFKAAFALLRWLGTALVNGPDRMNLSLGPADSVERRATLRVSVRYCPSQQRIDVVGIGNIDVGSATPTRKPGQPVERQGEAPEYSVPPCGAMLQQGSEFRGNVSAPQKFVHLVGCRERKPDLGQEARPYSDPVKR